MLEIIKKAAKRCLIIYEATLKRLDLFPRYLAIFAASLMIYIISVTLWWILFVCFTVFLLLAAYGRYLRDGKL